MAVLTFGKVYAALVTKDLIEIITVGLPLPPIVILGIMMLTFFVLGMVLDDTATLYHHANLRPHNQTVGL